MASTNLYTLPKNACSLSQRITDIRETLLWSYFESMNAGDFETTAALFAPDGVLNAPFEEPIVGREAIAPYLQIEAEGMQLDPREGVSQKFEDGNVEILIIGKVDTPLFGVNVSWQFFLNFLGEITSVTVKLLAEPQELLMLRSQTKLAGS